MSRANQRRRGTWHCDRARRGGSEACSGGRCGRRRDEVGQVTWCSERVSYKPRTYCTISTSPVCGRWTPCMAANRRAVGVPSPCSQSITSTIPWSIVYRAFVKVFLELLPFPFLRLVLRVRLKILNILSARFAFTKSV